MWWLTDYSGQPSVSAPVGAGKTRLRVRVKRFQGGGYHVLAHLDIAAEEEPNDALDQLGLLRVSPEQTRETRTCGARGTNTGTRFA